MSQAVAVQHREEILERVRAGEILREIATDFGVSKQALHKVLIDDPEYREAKRLQAASMIEQAKEKTWAASDPVDIAHAREVTKFAFRYAESVDAANWAPRQKIEHSGQVPTMQILVVNAPQTVDAAVLPAMPADDLTKVNE